MTPVLQKLSHAFRRVTLRDISHTFETLAIGLAGVRFSNGCNCPAA
jgi:hypothetical protein